jgi:hypothetical protein
MRTREMSCLGPVPGYAIVEQLLCGVGPTESALISAPH